MTESKLGPFAGEDPLPSTSPRPARPLTATPANVMLWELRFEGSYYNSDPRDSGTEHVSQSLFIACTTYQQAIAAGREAFEKFKHEYPDAEMTVHVVVLEELKPAGKPPRPRGNASNTHPLREIQLHVPNGYQLVVKLEPIPTAPPNRD